MADYKAMYYKLFHSITDANGILRAAIEVLEQAQADCEEIYIVTGEEEKSE